MSIDALISGKLHSQPAQRTSKNGNPFTTARVRASAGDESILCNVIAFDAGAQAALLSLGLGEAVSLAGSLKVGTWTDREGQPRPTLDLVASQVLSVYSITKRRRAAQPEQAGRQQQERPSHDAWVAGAPADLAQRRFDDGLDDGGPLDF